MLSGPPSSNPMFKAPPGATNDPVIDSYPQIGTAIGERPTPDDTYAGVEKKDIQGPSFKKHRWFLPYDIGVITRNAGNVIVISSPLTIVAGKVTLDVQEAPDYFIIGVLANNGANAELDVWMGDGGGFPFRIGNGGVIRMPAKGETKITIQAIGQSIKGTIIAVAGYGDNEVTFMPASQP